MASRKKILSNPAAFSDQELADAIACGEITVYELSKTGILTPMRRRRIEQCMDRPKQEAVMPPTVEEQKVASQAIEPAYIEHTPTTPPQPPVIPPQPVIEGTPINQPPVTPNESVINAPVINAPVINAPVINAPASSPLPPPIPSGYTDPISVATPPPVPQQSVYVSPSIDEQNLDNFTIVNGGLFRHPLSFRGRIARLEYFISYIIYAAVYTLCMFANIASRGNPAVGIISFCALLFAMYFLIAQTAKRCHDRGNSGWFQLIPVYNFILLFLPGELGINKYGTNPAN